MKIEKFIFISLTLAISIFTFSHSVHAQRGTSDQCIVIRGATGNPNCSGSSDSMRQGNSNSANRNQQIQNAIGAFGAAMEQSARQQAERERQEDARRQQEEWSRQQQERARQQQINQQVQAAIQQAQQDPSLNPFGKGTDSPPNGNGAPAADPSTDLTGQSCKWLVVRDEESCGSRSCFYSEGQTVAFGPRAYRCESGRWAKVRDCNQSLNDLRKKECQRDIVSIFGSPGTKEVPSQKIHKED